VYIIVRYTDAPVAVPRAGREIPWRRLRHIRPQQTAIVGPLDPRPDRDVQRPQQVGRLGFFILPKRCSFAASPDWRPLASCTAHPWQITAADEKCYEKNRINRVFWRSSFYAIRVILNFDLNFE